MAYSNQKNDRKKSSTYDEKVIDDEFFGVIEELQKEKALKKRNKDENDIDLSDAPTDESDVIAEEEEILKPSDDYAFIKTIQMLKARDPKIFDKNVKIYDEESAKKMIPEEILEASKKRVEGFKKVLQDSNKKIVTYTDVVREQIMKKNIGEDSDENESNPKLTEEEIERQRMLENAPATLEKKALDKFINKVNEQEIDDEIIVVKKSENKKEDDLIEQAKKSEKIVTNWMKNQITKTLSEEKNKDDADKFLAEYIENQAWIPKIDELSDQSEEKSDDILNEDKQLYAQELYEDAYNHRKMESGMDNIISFATAMNSNLRRKKSKRAEQRIKKLERKREEEKNRKTELGKKKGEKRREIGKKIAILAMASGYSVDEFIEKYKNHPIMKEIKKGDMKLDRLTEVIDDMYDDTYYNKKEEGMDDHDEVFNPVKPEFSPMSSAITSPDSSQISQILSEDDSSENENENNGDKSDNDKKTEDTEDSSSDSDISRNEKNEETKKGITNLMEQLNNYLGDDSDKEETNENEQKDENAENLSNDNKDNKKTIDITKKLDSALDELNGMEEGDYIEGFGRVKFKYISVPKENFGLSEEDILNLSDKDLNQVVSMKQLAPYREKDPAPNYKYLRNLKKENKIKKIVSKTEFTEKMEKIFAEQEKKAKEENKKQKTAKSIIERKLEEGKPILRRDRGEKRKGKAQRDRLKKRKLLKVGGDEQRLQAYGSLIKNRDNKNKVKSGDNKCNNNNKEK